MQTSAIIGFAAGIILIYLVGYLLMVPGKYAVRMLINAVLGALGLLLINLVGPVWGISVGINAVTALAVGFLGVPGVVLLVILKGIL